MTHYTIQSAAEELRTSPMLLRLILITHGIAPENDVITEQQLEDIRLTVYRMTKEERGE